MAQAATSSGEDEFQPIDEFIVKPWFSISIGPIDLGVSKAVVYMWIAAAISIGDRVLAARRAAASSRAGCRRSSS